jgi:uncharacterized membrane protein
MKQTQHTEYTFQSYSVWAGIALLLFLIPGTFGLVTLFKAFGLASLHESIIKAILVLMIVGWLLLIRRWITTTATVQINPNGLVFGNLPRMLSFAKTDHFIFWNEIENWSHTEAQLSAHSFSPMVFTLRLTDKRKIEIMVADEKAFAPFLADFKSNIEKYNLKNLAVPAIQPKQPNQPSKLFGYLLITLVFLTLLVLTAGLGLGYFDFEKTNELGRIGYLLVSMGSLILYGFAMRAVYNRKPEG